MSVVNRVRVNARGFLLFGVAALSIAVVDRPNSPAFAQSQATALTADQRVAIQTAVQTALADIDPSLGAAARNQAIAQALAQVATAQITQNGVGALSAVVSDAIAAGVPAPQVIAPILPVAANLGISGINAVNAVTQGAVAAGASPVQTAEAIIAVAAQTNVTSNAVGTGLGQAAAALSGTNRNAASQIALVVANEAPLSTSQAFGSSVLASGGSQQLASVAQQSPTASFITGAVNNTNNANNNGNNNNANNNGNNNNGNNNNGNNNNGNSGNNNGGAIVTFVSSGVPLGSGVSAANAPTVNLVSGASQQIAAVGTTLTCTTPSCS